MKNQNNHLSQGSIMEPILYNIYRNDQSTSSGTKEFIYGDYTAMQFTEVIFQVVLKSRWNLK